MKTFKQEVAEYLRVDESMVDVNRLETQQVMNLLEGIKGVQLFNDTSEPTEYRVDELERRVSRLEGNNG